MKEVIKKEEVWKIYKALPESLQEAIFSEDTSEAIWNIARLYNIKKVPVLAKNVGDVLLGLLPPEEFQEAIEKELGIDKDIAKKITRQVEHFIFNPVKEDLEILYHPEKAEEKKEEKEDVYREPIE
jgi:hypothetical protein